MVMDWIGDKDLLWVGMWIIAIMFAIYGIRQNNELKDQNNELKEKMDEEDSTKDILDGAEKVQKWANIRNVDKNHYERLLRSDEAVFNGMKNVANDVTQTRNAVEGLTAAATAMKSQSGDAGDMLDRVKAVESIQGEMKSELVAGREDVRLLMEFGDSQAVKVDQCLRLLNEIRGWQD
jgi:hypothetical protein